jgi:predicted deacetylase
MQSKINISIDDVSPHPLSSLAIVDKCQRIIDKIPDAKFTFFVPISYWRTITPSVSTKEPLQIDLFPDFCEGLLKLDDSHYEIGYHGYHHGIPGSSDNDEFRDLTEENATKLFEAMFEIVKKAGLHKKFKPIFRPPAWRMSAASFNAAESVGIKILALLKEDYALEHYKGNDLKFKNVIYATCYPPIKKLEMSDNVEIVYHACEWDKNYLSDTRVDELIDFLQEANDSQFCFMGEMI